MIREILCYAASFLAEAFTVWVYMDYLFTRKKNTWMMVLSFVLGYLFLTLISQLKNTTLNAVAYFAVNYILVRINYLCSVKTTLLHAAFLCFVMTVSEVLVALMFGVVGLEFSYYTRNFYVLVTLTVLSRMLNLVFSVIGSRIFAPKRTIHQEPHLMMLFCSLPVLSAVIAIFTVYYGMTSGVTSSDGLMMLTTILTLLVVNLIFLALYNYIAKANDEYLTLQLSIQKEQADIVYYEALQEQYENQRILVHDIKKHLGVIDALAKQEGATAIESYVSDLNITFASSNQAKLCTDPILNLILLHFRDACSEAEVDFQCDVRENISEFMDASSVTTLYGNLLSNALEAAATSKEKQIELSVTWYEMQSVVVISVVNTCGVVPIPDGFGGFCTSKKDKQSHGVGLRSIERIVKKYNGIATMYYDSNENQFHHVIQFPRNQS